MKHFLIPQYRPTARFWQIIIGLHLSFVLFSGFTWHRKVVYDSMIIEMGSQAPSGTGRGAYGTTTTKSVALSKPLPEEEKTEEIVVKNEPIVDEQTNQNTLPDLKKKKHTEVVAPIEKIAEKGMKKLPDKKLSTTEKDTKKNIHQEKKLPKVSTKDAKSKTSGNKASSKNRSQDKVVQSQSALDMLGAQYGTSYGNAIDDELGSIGSSIQGYETAITDIKSHVTAFWNLPFVPPKGAFVTFHIILNTKGELVSVKKIASSGNGLLDASAQVAIEQASPFPLPQDPALRQDCLDMELTLRPE